MELRNAAALEVESSGAVGNVRRTLTFSISGMRIIIIINQLDMLKISALSPEYLNTSE